jgi:hypothetical protein
MHQVKIFSGEEDQTQQLEAEINKWLRESKAKVVQIFGNIAPQSVNPAGSAGVGSTPNRRFVASDVFITVLYETA